MVDNNGLDQEWLIIMVDTSSTAQGGGGSFRIGTYGRGWLL